MKVVLFVIALRFDEPWAIAAPEREAGAIDLPLAVDPTGALAVPTTSVVGSLREHLARLPRLDPTQGLDETWLGGTAAGSRTEKPVVPPASRVRFLGTKVSNNAASVIRGQTAMDPRRGAPRPRGLRSAQVAPAGVDVQIYGRIDEVDQAPNELFDAIGSWRPWLGRSRSGGMGLATVTSLRSGVLDLTDPRDLATWLGRGGPELVEAVASTPRKMPGATDDPTAALRLPVLRFQAEDGVLFQGDRDRSTVRPYTRGDGIPVIEGSAIKGVLRSRCGFILRTIGVDACTDQMGCARVECPLCWLFGSSGRRGRIRVSAAVLEGGGKTDRHHVAINRVSGGASEHLLYQESDLPICPIMTLAIRLFADPEPVPAWVSPLVAAAILDIHDGFVGLGSRTARGLGTLRLHDGHAVEQLRAHMVSGALGAVREWARRDDKGELDGGR